MANVDNPRGFTNPQTFHGGPPRVTKYKSNGSAAIYKGDLVKKDGSGRVLTIIGAEDNPIGVAVNYAAATAGAVVYVYDDLANTTFEVQVDSNDITDDTAVGNFFDVTFTTGDTVTLQSAHELDGDGTTYDTLTLVEMIARSDNDDSLTNNKVRVQVRVDSQAQVIT
tara:strand:- start:4891 stop:5391 length:501 start_codon:yes stop_codon:yes gene_type:complete